MRRVQSRDAASDLDEIIDAAQRDPIEIQGADGTIGVMISFEALKRLIARNERVDSTTLERLMARNSNRFAGVFRSLAEWEAANEPPEPESGPCPTPPPGCRV